MKYIIILAVILGLGWYLTFNRLSVANDKINTLESEKNTLETTIERYKNAQVESSITIKKLRDQIRNNKENTDWYNTPVPVELLNVLQERHNRSKTN